MAGGATDQSVRIALCTDDDPVGGITIHEDGTWWHSDFTGQVAACEGSSVPCMASPIPLSLPPGGYQGGNLDVQWQTGNIDFYMISVEVGGETKAGSRAETKAAIYAYDYDLNEGITRLVITGKDRRGFSSVYHRCAGKLTLDDLAEVSRPNGR